LSTPEGRWVFNASGEVQPFETVGANERRRIRDRFTSSMLDSYLNALGIDAFDPAANLPPGSSAELVDVQGL